MEIKDHSKLVAFYQANGKLITLWHQTPKGITIGYEGWIKGIYLALAFNLIGEIHQTARRWRRFQQCFFRW